MQANLSMSLVWQCDSYLQVKSPVFILKRHWCCASFIIGYLKEKPSIQDTCNPQFTQLHSVLAFTIVF